MINLYPIKVPGYVIPFIKKEMHGCYEITGNECFSVMSVEPNSIMGMFLRRRIDKDYKIKEYRLVLYTQKIGNNTSFSAEILEYQKKGQFNVDLTFSELEDFFKFIDFVFRQSFYFFVKGSVSDESKDNEVRKSIHQFIEEYDLLEYGYSENQMRYIYYEYRKVGGISNLQKNTGLSKLF